MLQTSSQSISVAEIKTHADDQTGICFDARPYPAMVLYRFSSRQVCYIALVKTASSSTGAMYAHREEKYYCSTLLYSTMYISVAVVKQVLHHWIDGDPGLRGLIICVRASSADKTVGYCNGWVEA